MMAEMGMTMDMPWTAADVFFTFAMWAVMMVGMMAGTAAPVLLLFAAARAGRGERGVPLAVLMFGLGYLTVWVGLQRVRRARAVGAAPGGDAVAGHGGVEPASGRRDSHRGRRVSTDAVERRVPDALPKSAGVPDDELARRNSGARSGWAFRHGAYCLGCCWALMCVLFVVGVMNLVWVAALTGFVLVEKIGPLPLSWREWPAQ